MGRGAGLERGAKFGFQDQLRAWLADSAPVAFQASARPWEHELDTSGTAGAFSTGFGVRFFQVSRRRTFLGGHLFPGRSAWWRWCCRRSRRTRRGK